MTTTPHTAVGPGRRLKDAEEAEMICDGCTAGDHCGQPGETSTRCFCQHRPRKNASQTPRPETPHTAVSGPPARVVDVPLPDGAARPADGDGDALSAVLRDVPTVVLLSAWQRFHRRHAFTAATHLRRVIAARLDRTGRQA